MFNLLPEEQKREIQKDYKRRRLIAGLFFLGSMGFVVFLILLPSLIVVNLKHSAILETQEKLTAENPELLNIKELESEIDLQKKKLDVIGLEEVLPSFVINQILSSLSSGVSINSFLIQKREENIRISLRGKASTRESLLSFSKKVEEKEIFSDVNLPVSDLAKDKDISFSLSFIIDMKKNAKE